MTRALLPLYSATLFLAALLLFLVEPMTGKLLLPLLGGAPAVWNGCMLFFQAMLLAGYAYAYLISRRLGLRPQFLLHGLLLLGAALVLPMSAGAIGIPPAEAWPVPWLLLALIRLIGLPFFVLAVTAPLLQRWFSLSGHPAAGDPYFLYAASNLGSFAALLGFPLLLEPMLTGHSQALGWSLGYGLMALLMGACGFAVLRRVPAASGAGGPTAAAPDAPVTSRDRLFWLLLSLVPSSLLLGVTSYISSDIAAVPLLWVLPLALYLLSFVVTFAHRPVIGRAAALKLQVFLLILVALPLADESLGLIRLPLHAAAFFATALVCHGELARRRPATSHLTEFYFWIALGGLLGGAFNALLAPVLFASVAEYPLMMAAACLLRPRQAASPGRGRWSELAIDLASPAALALLFLASLPTVDMKLDLTLKLAFIAGAALAGCVLLAAQGRPRALALGLAVMFFLPGLLGSGGTMLLQDRSFFGVMRVREAEAGRLFILMHGITGHGFAFRDPARRLEPLGYYHAEGPAGQVLRALPAADLDRVGIIGLGTGALACYARAGQDWTFYEIDPLVARIARDGRFFHFLSDCPAPPGIVLGDGRLSIARTADGSFDLLILDAFTSDAIPVHLLTREALALYLAKLRPGGRLLIHISNNSLDLLPVVAAGAAAVGAAGRYEGYFPANAQPGSFERMASVWVLLAREESALGFLDADRRWAPLPPAEAARAWTDDYSNIVGAIRW
jgi:spermidine synthase